MEQERDRKRNREGGENIKDSEENRKPYKEGRVFKCN